MNIDFSAASEVMNKLATKMAGFAILIFLAYLVVYIFLRLVKVPEKIANTIGALAILVAAYLLISNNYFDL